MKQHGRDAAIDRVQRELTTIGRRSTARIRRESEALSDVDRSFLAYIQAHPGCRAVDIAAHFGLNRSTVSRQFAALSDAGLLSTEAATDASPARGVALRLTAEGEKALAAAAQRLREDLTRRLSGWDANDLDTFARLLELFNDSPDT